MGRLDVSGGLGEIELLDNGEGVTHTGLALALEASLDPPEHVRGQGDVAGSGQSVGELPDVVVDAKDLLEQEHSGPYSGLWNSAIGVELLALDKDGFISGCCSHATTVLLTPLRARVPQIGLPPVADGGRHRHLARS